MRFKSAKNGGAEPDSASFREAVPKDRNYGIDCLRILSMGFVVVLHVLGQGGVLSSVRPGTWAYGTAWFLECFSYPAVDLFALISGYAGANEREGFRPSKMLLFWLRILFYTLGITALFAVFLPGSVTGTHVLHAFLPVTYAQYWYMTAYFALLVFKPALNAAAAMMKKRDALWFSALTLFLFQCLPVFLSVSPYGLSGGYSAIWLMVLYLIGGFLKIFRVGERLKPVFWLLFAVLSGILTFVCKWFGFGNLTNYLSPTVVFEAAGFLLFFAGLRIRRGKKVLARCSEAALSCYLIHVHPLIWEHVMAGFASKFSSFSLPLFFLSVLGSALGILTFSTLLDLLRQGLFSALLLKDRLQSLFREKSRRLPVNE